MVLHHPFRPRRNGVKHERRHRGFLEVCRLTDQCVLLWGNANLQAMTSGLGCTIAHKLSVACVRTLSGQNFCGTAPSRCPGRPAHRRMLALVATLMRDCQYFNTSTIGNVARLTCSAGSPTP